MFYSIHEISLMSNAHSKEISKSCRMCKQCNKKNNNQKNIKRILNAAIFSKILNNFK